MTEPDFIIVGRAYQIAADREINLMADDIAIGKTAAVIKTKPRGVARITGGAGNAARIVALLGGMVADQRHDVARDASFIDG
jgi:hypothetical protein